MENESLGARALVDDMKERTARYATWTPEEIFAQVVSRPQAGIIDF